MNVYERISAVSDSLKYLGLHDYVNELNGVCEELDTLDGELEEVEALAPKKITAIRKQLLTNWRKEIG